MSAQKSQQNTQDTFPLGAKGLSKKGSLKRSHFFIFSSHFFRSNRWIILAFGALILSVYVNDHRLRLDIQQQTEFLKSELVIEMHEFNQLQRETLRLNRLLVAEPLSSTEPLALHTDLVQSRITIVQKSLENGQSSWYRNDSISADIRALINIWAAIRLDLLALQEMPENARLRQGVIAQLEVLEADINKISLFNNRLHWEEYQALLKNQNASLNLLLLLITLFFLFAALFLLYAIRFAQAREQLLANMEKISTTDELTQIANRRYFNQTLTLEWNRMMREQKYIALILCDVDYFKRYNDCYGHQAGDVCLHKIAQVLGMVTHRAGDLAARYGGEEFAIILPNTSLDTAQRAAALLHTQIAKAAIAHKDSSVSDYVTMSVGVAIGIPNPNISIDYALKQADEALYQAKENGRNQSCLNIFNCEKLSEWSRTVVSKI